MPNGIRIRSAVFPQCTGQTDRQTDGRTDRQIVHENDDDDDDDEIAYFTVRQKTRELVLSTAPKI